MMTASYCQHFGARYQQEAAAMLDGQMGVAAIARFFSLS